MMKKNEKPQPEIMKRSKKDVARERSAAALRENLKRRKDRERNKGDEVHLRPTK